MEKTGPPPMIHTLGTSTRGPEEFMEILVAYGIERVVDVRRFPTSKHDHFKREHLEAALNARGVKYLYLGEELGGYRRGGTKPTWRLASSSGGSRR